MNESALKERLKVIASEKKIPFNKIWKQLLLERFLVRLSESAYQDKFIFKGGLLLAQYISINRETIDIDLLMTKIKSESQQIENAINEIALININDGFIFNFASLEELTQPHMEYTGYRVILDVKFGKMKDKIQIDIGVGDIVDPIDFKVSPFEYKGKPIFSGEISLLVYPPEFIFAEKLETIISKGKTNSRMKDYHDVIIMLREPNLLNLNHLPNAINGTFQNRNTEKSFPIHFDEDTMATMQRFWSLHLQDLAGFKAKLNLPEQYTDILNEINNWVLSNQVL